MSKTHWQDISMSHFATLKQDTECEVLVVGGGITGLTAAYLLVQAGVKVCLVERDLIASGDTCCTTAHLTSVPDLRLTKLVQTFGKDAAKMVWQGGNAAINTIQQIANRESIDCDFRRIPGFLHGSLTGTRDESSELQKEQQLCEELGFDATYLESIPEVGKPGIRFANQAKFHPLKYLSGLAAAITAKGGTIYEHSEAQEFSEKPRMVKVNGKQIKCDYIVIATHVPLTGEAGLLSSALLQTKLASYNSYVIGAQIARDSFPEACYWDTSNPYYYLRVDRTTTAGYAIFGGQDHKTGQVSDPKSRYDDLEAQLKKLIPDAKTERRWSGQVVESHDGLPYMGETAERQFVATGFSGNGMTFGTLAAMMACDAVQKKENPWQELFAPERKKLSSAWDYVTENFDYAYYLVRDRLAGAEAKSVDDVQPGDGKVLKINGKQVACSRDKNGKLHGVSAICTHMGCVVHWNNAATSWDCPCHGSRFSPTGEVISGPAETALPTISIKSAK